jgi:signal transduction histidine kinase
VSISVIDQGEGISEDDLSRIFEEFVQVSPTQQLGTGLGLPISRRLATLLDGMLEVNSHPGTGSVFTLTLPAEGTPRVVDPADYHGAHGPQNGVENEVQKGPSEGVRVA